MRNRMLKQKKGLEYYTLIVSLVGIFILSFVVFTLFVKESQLGILPIGTAQFRILKAYSDGEKALLFVDDSAKIALGQAAYLYGAGGFHYPASTCEVNANSYGYWAKDLIEADDQCVPKRANNGLNCFPDENAMKLSLTGFFGPRFADFIGSFNALGGVQLPLNYEFRVSASAPGSTGLVGISKDPLVVTSPDIKYEVKPSFRENVSPDVVADGNAVAAIARQLLGEPESTVRATVLAADGTYGLDWDESFAYRETPSTCQYPIGTCACCTTETSCEEVKDVDEDGMPITREECTSYDVPAGDGTLYNVIPYDTFEIQMSVKVNDPASSTGHRQFLVYDRQSNRLALKELEYDFALNWIDASPEDATESCSCGVGHPC